MTEDIGEKKGDDQPANEGDGGKEDGLSEQLRTDVEEVLKGWQTQFTREEFGQKLFAAWWPGRTQAEVLEWMVARFGSFYGRIKTAQDNGELYPWIVPYSATVLLESMFQACVGFWLLAGKPDDRNELLPSVKDYIGLQVRCFVMMVGR